MSARLPERKPWPLKAVVIAIALVILPYTWITLKYRRPGPAYEPYADTKTRATVTRLLSAGFQRVVLSAERPADAARTIEAGQTAAPITDAPAGLPASLGETLIDQPVLPERYDHVSAPGEVNSLLPWKVAFTCVQSDQKVQLGGSELYVREEAVVLVPQLESLDGALQARSREVRVVLTIPAGALKPGAYVVTLAGAAQSKTWTLQVR